ncbi:MAG TPA: YkvA family protein [Chthoniobacterales bacterium]|nr:YkvA family protein [Chthoniobacterales bacterium]
MRKAKKKTPSRKSKPAAKAKKNRSPALKERLEAEFAQAVKSAKSYVGDPERLRALFREAANEVAALPRDPFKETWPYLQTMLRLIRAYSRGEYRHVTESTVVVIVAAIIYLVNPLDLIPDAIPSLGFLDDATVLALALRRTRQDLDDFMTWETATP